MGFNDMFGRAHIGVEKVVTPAPGGIVALDTVEADAAFGAEFGNDGGTPLVGKVECPIVLTGF